MKDQDVTNAELDFTPTTTSCTARTATRRRMREGWGVMVAVSRELIEQVLALPARQRIRGVWVRRSAVLHVRELPAQRLLAGTLRLPQHGHRPIDTVRLARDVVWLGETVLPI